ncbi:MAG: Crp/Fnr family transcriptional regulator [Chloroflexi bacterium]|nr:Crp/Fnr family transcriptional regulator [Chloroflexota bacterium]
MPIPHNALSLAQVGIFEGVPADTLSKYIHVNTHRRGEYVFHAGDPADTVFVLLDGVVKKTYINPGGDEKIISVIQRGDVFGHLFLGKYRYRISSAMILSEATIGRVSESHLYSLIEQYPRVGIALIRYYADEQRETLARLHALMHLDAQQRLLGTLLYLARRYCCSDGIWFNLPPGLSQEDIANIACLNRSTVSLLINDLRRQAILGGKGRWLTINRQAVEDMLRAAGVEILE